MLKKIEIFMSIMLAVVAALILMASAGRRAAVPAPETTVPTTQATVPETGSVTQPLAPPPTEPIPDTQARSQVEQILNAAQLERTAETRRTVNDALHASARTAGQSADSHGYALAQVLEERQVNPIAAFWKLVHGGLYEKQADGSGELSVVGFQTPDQTAKEYPYSEEGAGQLLTDLLTLAAQMEDGLALERSLLGANLTVESNRIRYSEKEQCQYAYFTCTSERATYILCFYLRGAEQIDDVEFQLLYLRHASGETEDLAAMDYNAKKQASALMAASELLMTGKSRAGEGLIPFSYAVGEAQAKVERTEFKGTPDRGSLINYRLKK